MKMTKMKTIDTRYSDHISDLIQNAFKSLFCENLLYYCCCYYVLTDGGDDCYYSFSTHAFLVFYFIFIYFLKFEKVMNF